MPSFPGYASVVAARNQGTLWITTNSSKSCSFNSEKYRWLSPALCFSGTESRDHVRHH